MIRVLVVDDSALMRKLIPQILERDSSIQVVGTAMDGTFGLRKIEELKPDVVTLDMEMPHMDGIETLKHMTGAHKVPVIVVSSYTTHGTSLTFRALQHGAFDFVPKPQEGAAFAMDSVAEELIAKIKAAANSRSIQIPAIQLEAEFDIGPKKRRPAKPLSPSARTSPTKIVAIGISTGGPNALLYLLSQFPADFPGTILIVQHMPERFTGMFASRLDDACAIEVKEAEGGDLLLAGRALVCPGNRHMRVRHMTLGDTVLLSDDPKVNGHRPSVDVLFRSVAQEFGAKAIGVLMTGMGEDGAEAMGDIKSAGGMTIAQNESSCVVYGMPKAAVDRGTAVRVVPLDAIATMLQTLCSAERPKKM